MDYEKKYKDALQRAKHALDCDRNNLVSTDVPLIYSMFPELKESEDEEVRKALVDLVKCNERSGYTLLNNVSTSSMIAWLEKQGNSPIKWNKNTKDCKPKVSHSVLMKTTHGIAEGEWQGEHMTSRRHTHRTLRC